MIGCQKKGVNIPSIAQLEERETVIGYLGHLKVTGSIPVRRIFIAAHAD